MPYGRIKSQFPGPETACAVHKFMCHACNMRHAAAK